MNSPLLLLIVGSLISLVSTAVGIFLSHWLQMKRVAAQVKQHPTQVIYNKQTEFFDKAVDVLDAINGYISTIDVWLPEPGEEARKKVANAAKRNRPLTKLHELLERYYMYLPEELLSQANELFYECLRLGDMPTQNQTHKCLDLLFALQNTIREVVGIDAVSGDLLKAFGSAEKEAKSKSDER
jgi:hypothetical protein